MKRKSMIAALASCLLVLALGVGGFTLAVLKDQTDEKNNMFAPGVVSTDIHENSSGTPESSNTIPYENNVAVKQVQIQNTGTVSVFVRVMLIPGWKTVDGVAQTGDLQFGKAPYTIDGNRLVMGDITLELNARWEEYWFYDAASGYFYCRDEVVAGSASAVLLEKVILSDGVDAASGWENLQVEVLSDAIQAANGAVAAVWPVQLVGGQLTPA